MCQKPKLGRTRNGFKTTVKIFRVVKKCGMHDSFILFLTILTFLGIITSTVNSWIAKKNDDGQKVIINYIK